MRKKIKSFITVMILSLLVFKQIPYCSTNSIEESKNRSITNVYSIDPPYENGGTPPKTN